MVAISLDIQKICSLHGPVLTSDLGKYIEKYNKWSKYEPENPDGILVLHSSIHGNTKGVALKFVEILKEKGAKDVKVIDLTRDDMSEAISRSYQYGKLVLAASSYNMSVFPPMEHLLRLLKDKNYQNRKIGFIENGTWAPNANKEMEKIISEMKDIEIIEPKVTIKTTMTKDNIIQLEQLADELLK